MSGQVRNDFNASVPRGRGVFGSSLVERVRDRVKRPRNPYTAAKTSGRSCASMAALSMTDHTRVIFSPRNS